MQSYYPSAKIELKKCMEPCVSCFYLTYCIEYVWRSFIMNRYISKSYTMNKNRIDRQQTAKYFERCIWNR